MALLLETIENYNPETFQSAPILEYFQERYPNVASRQVKLSQFKRQLMELTPIDGFKNGHEYNVLMKKAKKNPELLPAELQLLRLDVELQQQIRSKQALSLDNKLNKSFVLPNSKVFFKEVVAGLKSKTFDKLFPALLLVSGRRTTEILKTAKFGTVKGGNVIFSGKLKSMFNTTEYSIPLLVKAGLFRKALKQLRLLLPEITENKLTNAQVQDEFKTRISNAFNRLGRKYNFKITAHTMRSLYVAFAEPKFKKKEQTTIAFTNQVLCQDTINSSLHYLSVVLE